MSKMLIILKTILESSKINSKHQMHFKEVSRKEMLSFNHYPPVKYIFKESTVLHQLTMVFGPLQWPTIIFNNFFMFFLEFMSGLNHAYFSVHISQIHIVMTTTVLIRRHGRLVIFLASHWSTEKYCALIGRK